MNTTSSEISLKKSLIPIIILISLLFYNIISFENNDWLGEYTYHYLLISSSVIAVFLGFLENIGISHIIKRIIESIKSITIPIIILLLVGALAGTWKVSGIIPAMVYYGLNLIDPSVFLPLTLIVSTLVSLTTGSSYTTSATVGIALVAVGIAFNIPAGMTAGAVISGAYFGDKMSPLSDTTNLAPAMAGTDLYSHIKYMTYTTVPTYVITLVIFIILSFNLSISGSGEMNEINNLSQTILNDFYISPYTFFNSSSCNSISLFKN
jgi:NhaC family Na+:H+ antiporter